MVLCWVDIDISTGLVEEFLALRKVSRQLDLYQSDFEISINIGQAEGDSVSKLVLDTFPRTEILEQGRSEVDLIQ